MDDLKEKIIKKAIEVRDNSRNSMKPYMSHSEDQLKKLFEDKAFMEERLKDTSLLSSLFSLLDELDAQEGRVVE